MANAAAAYGMQRTDLVLKIFDEVILANEASGVAFAQGDGQRVDFKASELLQQVKELLVENERTQRENLKLAERLLNASNGGEEAVLAAQERLTEKIVAQRNASDFPFRQQIEFIKSDIDALPYEVGDQIDAQLRPMAAHLAIIEAAASVRCWGGNAKGFALSFPKRNSRPRVAAARAPAGPDQGNDFAFPSPSHPRWKAGRMRVF